MYIKLDIYDFISYMNSEILNIKDLYIYMYIVGKYKIYLYELYKQIEKQSFWRSHLSCFAACANKIYISELCMYIVFILQYQKWQIV